MSIETASLPITVDFVVTKVDTDRIEVTRWGDTEKRYVDGYSHVTATSAVYTLTWTTSDPPAWGSTIAMEMHAPKGPGK